MPICIYRDTMSQRIRCPGSKAPSHKDEVVLRYLTDVSISIQTDHIACAILDVQIAVPDRNIQIIKTGHSITSDFDSVDTGFEVADLISTMPISKEEGVIAAAAQQCLSYFLSNYLLMPLEW